MISSLELYGAKTGNCLRVAVALEETSLAYVVRPLDLAAGAHRAPEHLARNPRGKVPVLAVRDGDGERMLTQSNAIQLWIDAEAPGRLLPPGGAARQLALERWLFLVTDVIASNRAANLLRRAGLAPEATAHLDGEAVAALAEAERFLADGAFLGGDTFSLADVAGVTIAAFYGEAIDWPRLPRLRRWFEASLARPAVQRGMAAFG